MSSLKPLNLSWALGAPLPPLNFVLPGLLPGALGLLVAPGATGKSSLALDIATSIALGRTVANGLFPASKPAKVVYLAGEENERIFAERLRVLVDMSEASRPELMDYLHVFPMAAENCLLVEDGKPTSLMTELLMQARDAKLVILDPLRRLHDGDENCSAAMTVFATAMEQLGKATGAAVIGLHHSNRASIGDGASQHASRGSSALVDAARWQINLSRMDEKSAEKLGISADERHQYVALDFAKTNYLPPRPRCWLKRQPNGRLELHTPERASGSLRSLAGARLI